MSALVKAGSGMISSVSQTTRGCMARFVGKVISPFTQTISFLLDLVGYILQDPDAWKIRPMVYKKELVDEEIREYVFELHGRAYVCRERLLVYAIRGKNRRTTGIRFTYWEPTIEDIIRLDVGELRKIKYS